MLKRLTLVALLSAGSFLCIQAQTRVPLYDDPAIVDAKGNRPEVSFFLPEKPTGMAILVIPGGGYGGISFGSEGAGTAHWLNSIGVTGVVLRYRLPEGEPKLPVSDAARALEVIAENAGKMGIDTSMVGVMGFSAGGHLAAMTLVSKHSALSPAFGILIYPVITMDKGLTHGGSSFNLLGRSPDQALVQDYSAELHVSPDTPPTLIVHCDDDPCVKPANSLMFYEALHNAGVKAELHIYDKGGHGWGGLKSEFPYYDEYKRTIERWLEIFR